jgi:hypothetical protein
MLYRRTIACAHQAPGHEGDDGAILVLTESIWRQALGLGTADKCPGQPFRRQRQRQRPVPAPRNCMRLSRTSVRHLRSIIRDNGQANALWFYEQEIRLPRPRRLHSSNKTRPRAQRMLN